MFQLNLPRTDVKLECYDERLFIWDFIRRRMVVLTAEEWVRQHFSHWMVELLGYPQARLGHEISLEQNGMKRRADAIFYDQEGRPLIIMEFKAPYVAISQKTFDQINHYNMVLKVPYLIVSNGLQHFCCHVSADGIRFLDEIPRYESVEYR